MPRSLDETLAAGRRHAEELQARAERWRLRRRQAFRRHLIGLSIASLVVLAAIAYAIHATAWLWLLAPLPTTATMALLRWRGGGIVLGMVAHGAGCAALVFIVPALVLSAGFGAAGSLLVYLFGLAAFPLLGGIAGWTWERVEHDTIQI